MTHSMTSSFVLKQNENGEIYFNFLNKDGAVVLISGNYTDKALAQEAIKEVKVNNWPPEKPKMVASSLSLKEQTVTIW